MAQAETNVVNTIMKELSPMGVRLFRNVRGMFLTKDYRPIRAGLLAPGASDLVGFTPITITPAMVGRKIAVFTVMEVKTQTGRASPEQLHFVDFVRDSGGFAGVVRSVEEAKNILK